MARITYAGHATVLIEVGGARLLTDPLLRDRLLVVLRRHAGLEADDLLPLDAVLISHLHHDHLDLRSLRRLGTELPVVAPPGCARFLAGRGFPNVIELSPGESTMIGGARVTAVEARHDGRRALGSGAAEAVGYIVRAEASVYFAGDTALFPEMEGFGGGLDLALLPVGGWGPSLGPGHLDPLDAARAAALLRPRIAVPIHWGTLTLIGGRRLWRARFEEPGSRFRDAMKNLAPEVEVRVLRPGETVELLKQARRAS